MNQKNKCRGGFYIRPEKGITLIALIITIIVMLILVAVTITVSLNGGLFGYARNAAKGTNEAIEGEQGLATLEENLTVDQLIAKYTSVHKWTRNVDTVTCSHCDISYELGEEIPYVADTVTTPYQLTAVKSGLGDAVTDGHELSEFEAGQVDSKGNQTIAQETGLTWVVLGVDDEDGDGTNESLLITTSRPVSASWDDKTLIYFYGKAGCNYAEEELNNICSKLYSNSKYGTARSMTIDDVNNCLGVTSWVEGQYHDGTYWKTTGNLTTKLRDLPTFNKIVANGTNTPDGKNIGEYELNGYEYYRYGLELKMEGKAEARTITQAENDLIFRGVYYWLASTGVYADGTYACFGPGYVTDDGFVDSYNILFYSNGDEYYNYGGLRPVVSLKSNIPIGE